jgi:hypothetical protein
MSDKPNNQTDARLDKLLRELPDKPVSSNFTARVMQAVEREAHTRPQVGSRAWWLRLIPRVAVAAVIIVAGAAGWHQYRVQQRTSMAQSVAAVSTAVAKVDPLTDPKVFANFDAINRMGPSPDRELLALLKSK